MHVYRGLYSCTWIFGISVCKVDMRCHYLELLRLFIYTCTSCLLAGRTTVHSVHPLFYLFYRVHLIRHFRQRCPEDIRHRFHRDVGVQRCPDIKKNYNMQACMQYVGIFGVAYRVKYTGIGLQFRKVE